MQIFDNQYHVLKYFVKPRMIDQIMLAHFNCLDTSTDDYRKVEAIKRQKDNGQKPSELIRFTDAKFDYSKVKTEFEKLRIMDANSFDSAFQLSVSEGLIDENMIPTVEGIMTINDLIEQYERLPEYVEQKNKDKEKDKKILK